MTQIDARITELVAPLTALERRREEIVAEINTLRSAQSEGTAAINVVLPARAGAPIDRNSTIKEKIALFRRLFRGRSDGIGSTTPSASRRTYLRKLRDS